MSMASAAPTSPAMSVSSTSSQAGPPGSPRNPRSCDMKPPRVRSRPVSSEAAGGALANAVGSNGAYGRLGRRLGAAGSAARRLGAGSGAGSAARRRARLGRSRLGSAHGRVLEVGRDPAPSPARRPRARRRLGRRGGARRPALDVLGSAGRLGLGRGLGVVAGPASAEHQPAVDEFAATVVGERLGLVEPQADDAADRVVADGHAVEGVGGLDRAAVVGDHDELRLVGEAAERIGEPPDVGLVERGIDLVEDAERHRPDLEHREQQRDRGQGPLAAGQHRERLLLLAGRPGDDLDAGRARGPTGRSATAGRSRRRRAARTGARRPSRAPGTSSGTGR